MTLAELLEQRAALVVARTTGALRTTFKSGGTERTTEFKSDGDMASALAAIDAEIARINGIRTSTIRLSLSKGY